MLVKSQASRTFIPKLVPNTGLQQMEIELLVVCIAQFKVVLYFQKIGTLLFFFTTGTTGVAQFENSTGVMITSVKSQSRSPLIRCRIAYGGWRALKNFADDSGLSCILLCVI